MNRISWNTLPELVQQFLRDVLAFRDVVLVIESGRPLVLVEPIPNSSTDMFVVEERAATENHGPVDLLDREMDRTLMADEPVVSPARRSG